MDASLFRFLPSVDECFSILPVELCSPRPLARAAINRFLDMARSRIRKGEIREERELAMDSLARELIEFMVEAMAPRFRKVINATGVVIHTNLGRSLLAKEAQQAVQLAASSYNNLEFDLDTGERGSRHHLVEDLICHLTGAEAALAVNNNAAAVLLTLSALCAGGEVLVSRGQLVEIGGSFRIPDVCEKSGAKLKEVGTTNRTHLKDYENGLNENTRALLRVHTSNYRIIGFTSDVPVEEMAAFAHAHGLPLLEDLGSGSLLDLTPYGLPYEPTAGAVLAAGADIVTFSGDKVLGGPQAGIIAGKKAYIEKIRSDQLMRALRCDKMTLAALEATLRLYAEPEKALQNVPTLHRITMPEAELKKRASALSRALKKGIAPEVAHITLVPGFSRVGGGSFPEHGMPTWLVAVEPTLREVAALRAELLASRPALVGRVEQNAFLLDPRTLDVEDTPVIVELFAGSLGTAL